MYIYIYVFIYIYIYMSIYICIYNIYIHATIFQDIRMPGNLI